MRIDNRTGLPTPWLARLAREVYARVRATEGPLPQWRRVEIAFLPCRRRRRLSSGGAVLGGGRMRVGVALPLDPARVARTLEHELLHLYGYRHPQMGTRATGDRYHSPRNLERYAWARDRWAANVRRAERRDATGRRLRATETSARQAGRLNPRSNRAAFVLGQMRANSGRAA